MSEYPIERRPLGSTGESVSVIGFGGVIVTSTYPERAANYVAEAFDRGVNYFDVSPFYGNAQERLGPALAPYRDRSFLACKSRQRKAEGIERELNESLRLLQTDHVDLYQFHSLQQVERDVEGLFAPSGAMEAVLKARDAGKIRFIGFSAHTEEAALAAMDAFDFDTILFPFNYFMWNQGNFGKRVYEKASEKGMGVLALKSLAQRAWTEQEKEQHFRPWPKCWYRPLEDTKAIELALRFTLSLPADAAIPPGHWDLFERCLQVAERGNLDALTEDDQATLASFVDEGRPLFEAAHA